MKKNFSLLPRISFSILLTIILLNISCSDDPSSPNIEEETPLASATIGSTGGKIETEDVSISIPSGALDGNYEIAISEISDDGGFGENTISGSFKISGLPNSYLAPIKFKVKYSVALTANSFIAMGNKVFDEVNSDSSFEYQLFEATDSAGFLISEIPGINLGVIEKSTSELNESNSSIDRIIKVISSYKEKRSENFVFHYPIVLESYISNVEKTFEDVFNIISNDLDLSFYPKPEHQTVIIKFLPGEKAVYGWYNLTGGQEQYLFYVNIDHILQNNFDQIKKRLGNIILNLEMIRYNNLGEFKRTIESWAEELFTDGEFKYPDNFEQSVMEPFKGLKNYSDNVEGHSIGLASILKYLAEDEELFGMKGLKKMHSNLGKDVDPISALLKTVDGNVVDWLPDFTQKYLMGEIYDLPQSSFFDNVPLEWNINSNTDTLKEFNYFPANYYPDISAKLFKINLNHQPEDDTYNMLFDMRGNTEFGLSLVVFGIKNNELTYLETAHAQDFIIPNLKEYYDKNIRQFLAVLVNTLGVPPYDGNSEVDLIIQIDNNFEGGGGLDLQYNLCRIEVYLQGLFEDTRWAEGTQVEYTTGVGTSHDYYDYEDTVRTISGSFYGNIFTGSFDNGEGWTQTATVTLSEEQDKIIDYSFEEIHAVWSDHRVLRKVSGSNIPVSNSKNTLFESRGENSCSSVFEIQLMTIRNETDTSKIVDFWCDENSRVIIQFYKN